jgi:hypothetical protein
MLVRQGVSGREFWVQRGPAEGLSRQIQEEVGFFLFFFLFARFFFFLFV